MPIKPIVKRATKSIKFCPLWKAAKEIIIKIKGAKSANLILVSRAIPPESAMHNSVPTTFARASNQTMEYVKSRLFSSKLGPTSIPFPKRASAPIKTAIEPDPGMPKRSVGTNPPPSFALLELSGPITPRTSPFPNFDLSFED